MNDIFMEYLVKKKKDTKDKVLIGLTVFGAVILSFVIITAMFGIAGIIFSGGQANPLSQMIFSIGLLIVAFAWYMVYFFVGTRNVEYEYIMTNNDFDIDKVMAKKGRKHLISFDVKEAVCIASVKDNENNSAYKNPPEGAKLLDYSTGSNISEAYFADVVIEGDRRIVVFQPTTKMVEAMWRFNPRAVHKNF